MQYALCLVASNHILSEPLMRNRISVVMKPQSNSKTHDEPVSDVQRTVATRSLALDTTAIEAVE